MSILKITIPSGVQLKGAAGIFSAGDVLYIGPNGRLSTTANGAAVAVVSTAGGYSVDGDPVTPPFALYYAKPGELTIDPNGAPVDIVKVYAGPAFKDPYGYTLAAPDGVIDVAKFGSLSDAIEFQRESGRKIGLIQGSYQIDSTLVLDQPGDSLYIARGATLEASDNFSGQSMVEVGNYVDTSIEHVDIYGGGAINARHIAARGISYLSARFSELQLSRIDGTTRRAVSMGANAAAGVTYEVNVTGLNSMHEQVQNHASSVCVYYEKATDCYLRGFVGVGYRKGVEVSANSYSVELSQCHVWGRSAHGAMTHGFSVFGDATINQCNADTPYDLINGAGDLYGFYLSGNTTGNGRTFMNTTLPSNGRVIGFAFTSDNKSRISVGRVHGGSTSNKFKAFATGETADTKVVEKVYADANSFVTAP